MEKETIKAIIKANLKVGIENSTSREDLVTMCKTYDRRVRDIIKEMIDKDMEPICAISANKGYYYPKDAEEAIRCRDEKKKRARATFAGVPALEKFIKEQSQVVIDFKDYEHD